MSNFVSRDVRSIYILIEKGLRNVDPLADAIMDSASDAYNLALILYKDDSYRRYLEASLLASDDIDEICDLFNLTSDVVTTYRSVFYDVQGLNQVQKLKLASACVNDEEKALKVWAVSQGLPFIKWRLGIRVEISPVDSIRAIHSDSYFKAREAFFSGATTESSREAMKWAKMTMETAKLLKSWVSDMDAASEELRIALQKVTSEDLDFGDIKNIYQDNEETFIETEAGASIDEILKENSAVE